jgi:hypothetical protein
MLSYVTKFGDENIALYEHRKSKSGGIPEAIKLRETNKYSLYNRFDSIVFDEGIIDLSQSQQEKVIDIDWSQIDSSNLTLEPTESS